MSGGEPLWRRVAGLYLSGIPADAGERMSTRAPADVSASPADDGDPTQEIIKLGEALDLVTLAQGYRSPAVPLLLRALIRVVRQVAADRATAEAAAAAEAATAAEEAAATAAEEEAAQREAREAEEAAAGGEAEKPVASGDTDENQDKGETPVSEAADEAAISAVPAGADMEAPLTAALEKRVKESDQKVAALTAAVGQLVDVLQRRARDGGGVDRRESPRFPGGNARIFIHGQSHDVVNWGKGGFLIRIAEADRFSRGGFDFHFVLDLPDETIEFQGRARPVRIERTTLAAEFAALDQATATKISEIVRRLAAAG